METTTVVLYLNDAVHVPNLYLLITASSMYDGKQNNDHSK